MTRLIFDNDMTAHVWAQQSQNEGRSHNGNFYFNGRTLYSYGTHYPVGIFVSAGGPVFMNSAKSTPTTEGKHKGPARRAVRHIAEVFYLPELDELADVIGRAANNGGVIPAPSDMPEGAADYHARNVSAYLAKHWQSIPADNAGAAWIMRAVRMGGTWAGLRARLSAKADKAGRDALARMKAAAVTEGRQTVAKPWGIMRAEAWAGANSFGQRGLAEMIRDARASRLATPKAHKRVRAELWRREKALRQIAETARNDADRYGNPGERTKARAVLSRLRRFKAGQIGAVPGFYGEPDGPAKLEAALALPTGAGWRMVSDMLRDLFALSVSIPTATRAAADALRIKADAIASEREGEERQRRDVAEARKRVSDTLRTFNRGRRTYRALVASGAWAGAPMPSAWAGEEPRSMTDQARARVLDAILSHVPDAAPWGTERGFELSPSLAERAARIAARASELAAELEPQRDAMRTAWERAETARRAAAEAERQRIAAMPEAERLAAWEAGELASDHVRQIERTRGPLLRTTGAEVEGCNVTGGTLETSQGATVPLRHAFRVFQFIALCRAERKAWREGGAWGPRSIRVGHFRVNSVATSGDFEAGCHSIKWAEVARLAERLGVSDCLATLPELAAELAEA